jgi:RimJ/RimL family protein N-acetyltransferase
MPIAMTDVASPPASVADDAELHTSTLRLRLLAPSESDRALYHALHASPEVMRAIGPPLEADEIDGRFGRVVRHNGARHPGHRAWAIDAATGRERLGLTVLLRDGGRAEFGIMLLPAAWRRGIAHAAIARLLPHAFDAMGLEHIDVSRPDDDFVAVLDGMFRPFHFQRRAGLRPGHAGWTLSRHAWARRRDDPHAAG